MLFTRTTANAPPTMLPPALSFARDAALRDESHLVRGLAVTVLGELGDERGRDALSQAVSDSNDFVRSRARIALAEYEKRRRVPSSRSGGGGDVVAVTNMGKLLSGGVMLSGFAFLAFLTSIIASTLTEKLLTLKGKKTMQDAINKLRQHYVVCGYGRVGSAICAELTQNGITFSGCPRNTDSIG